MHIQLPSNFHGESVYGFVRLFESYLSNPNSVFCFSNSHNCHPTGLLLLGSFLRKARHGIIEERFEVKDEFNYLGSIGFYRSIGLNVGKEINKLQPSSNFIPIRKLDFKESAKTGYNPYDLIETTAKEICRVMASADAALLSKTLEYSVQEILRNVYEHSNKNVLWYAAQHWPTLGIVEVSILDEGVGIRNSLSNRIKEIETDDDAIELATEEGVTKSNKKPTGLNDHENTGYGLFKIRQIAEIAGNLIVCSGDAVVDYGSDQKNKFKCSHNGTIVGLRLFVDKLKSNEAKLKGILKPGR